MSDVTTRLETIFAIEDQRQRQEGLLQYARSLKVNYVKARKEDGSYNEDYLAVLIYDAEENKRKGRFANLGILAVAVFVFLVILAAIVLIYFMTSSFFKGRQQEEEGRNRTCPAGQVVWLKTNDGGANG